MAEYRIVFKDTRIDGKNGVRFYAECKPAPPKKKEKWTLAQNIGEIHWAKILMDMRNIGVNPKCLKK